MAAFRESGSFGVAPLSAARGRWTSRAAGRPGQAGAFRHFGLGDCRVIVSSSVICVYPLGNVARVLPRGEDIDVEGQTVMVHEA